MEKNKPTVRVPREPLEGAKWRVSEHNTTLTRLVSESLRQLSVEGDPLDDAPAVRRLSGTLSPDASMGDYRQYLEEKHSA